MNTQIEQVAQIHDWLRFGVRLMVDDEDAVVVTSTLDAEIGHATFRVKVDSRDVGKVIGKEGRTARALRLLLRAQAQKNKMVYVLDIGDGYGTEKEESHDEEKDTRDRA
jgi:predicted RNA-binding protein YlqC (UPF0109 family)